MDVLDVWERMVLEYKGSIQYFSKAIEHEEDEGKRKEITSMIRDMKIAVEKILRYCSPAFQQEYQELLKKKKNYNPVLLEPDKLDRMPENKSLNYYVIPQNVEEAAIQHLCQDDSPNELEGMAIDWTSFFSNRQLDAIQMQSEGLKYAEIGELMGGIERGTVSKHLQIARKKASRGLSVQMELDF